MKYLLTQKYYALRPFSAEGTLEELAEIITASGCVITYLDDHHHGPEQCWDEHAPGYAGPGWYFKIRNIDEEFTQALSLEDAIRQVGSHDTSGFLLTPLD